jgi:polysaccharide deacetylase 2 family uncharacterized protein YibQ
VKIPKLPKLPKLPGLPKLPKASKLKKLFKKKSDDDEFDDDEDLDEDADEGSDAGAGDKAAPGDSKEDPKEDSKEDRPDDDPDFGDDDDDDDYDDDLDEKEKRKPLIIAAAGAFVLFAGIAGGAGWWYFSGEEATPAKMAGQSPVKARDPAKGPMVGMALPPKPGTPNAFMSREAGSAQRSGPVAAPQRAPGTPPGGRAASPGTSAEPTFASTSGDIGGRFGGRANPLGGSLNALGGTAQEQGTGLIIPSVTSVTLRTIPDYSPPGIPLGATPDARLIETKEGLPGPLPIIGKDGTEPWKTYSRPYNSDEPGLRVAIVITGLGLSRAATMSAISKLPPQVTLALDPYAKDLSDWLVRSRLVGHEVMVALPMESERFPIHDAGPFSMNTSLKVEENISRLEQVLSQFTGYFGVATVMGSRFGTSEKLLRPVLEVLKARGLMLLATGPQKDLLAPKIAAKIGLPRAVSDLTIDEEPSRSEIEIKLMRLEEIIRENKSAVAIARPYPATIAQLAAWTKKLQGKKISLVPVSALASQKPLEQ